MDKSGRWRRIWILSSAGRAIRDAGVAIDCEVSVWRCSGKGLTLRTIIEAVGRYFRWKAESDGLRIE